MPVLLTVLALIVVFLAVLLARAAAFKPHEAALPAREEIHVNSDKAVHDLAAMVRCRTVSDKDRSREDQAEFDKFAALLPTLFPNVYRTCTLETPNDRSMLFHWKGKSPDSPTILMAHYDVVSVVEEDWSKPAFEGLLEDGVLWGRGTLDTKGTLNGILQAAEQLMGEGFVPAHDVYFAFAGNEEISGNGAPAIVKLFQERGVTPGLVVDEGGAVVQDVFPGVKRPCALIGIGEKGPMNLEFSVKSAGGHASSPPPHTPVGKLSDACVKVENHPFSFQLTKPAAEMFDTLGRHSTFLYRLIFANLWCFRPMLDSICKKGGGELNALVRTTVAFTQMEGSKGMNVLPPQARMVANLRLIGDDTVDSAVSYLKQVIGDEDIQLRVIEGENPSRTSVTGGEAWKRVTDAVSGTWPEALVSPYLMIACSDSRHYGILSDKVYRFSAMALSSAERATIHGNDERVPVTTIAQTAEFYLRLLRKS